MNTMSSEQFMREATYRATMLTTVKAKELGIVTDEDAQRIHRRLIARDLPPIGRLSVPLVLDISGKESDV